MAATAIPSRLAEVGVTKLYRRGTIPAVTPVAIVGSRRASGYGRRVAKSLAARLATAGIPVVSGLAFGIDCAAHEGALETRGRTVAVLPCGLADADISPRTNLPLAKRISEFGALVSEYPAGTTARKEHYAARNRLIAAMADHVVVVEAEQPSGSLITARHAADYNREVWAVPGPIDSPTSAGTNQLIAEGANPLVSVEEFLKTIGATGIAVAGTGGVLDFLGSSPTHLDQLLDKAPDPSSVEAELTKLELTGLVRHLGGRYYVRT